MAYHRIESPTQSVRIAAKQETSLEVWGREPRGGSPFLKVQAYKRLLPHSERGIQFDAHILPDPDGHPHRACWSGDRPGILSREDETGEFIAINVFNFKNAQPPMERGETWQRI